MEIAARTVWSLILQVSPHQTKVNMCTGSVSYQWWIQDFPEGVRQLPKVLIFFNFFAENCMKMKEFGPVGGGGGVPISPVESANGYF